jgi:tetratricopeptide (TPR) repeat protein
LIFPQPRLCFMNFRTLAQQPIPRAVAHAAILFGLINPVVAAPIRNKPMGSQETAIRRPPEADAALQKFEAGQLDQAVKLLEQASAKHPELPPPRVMLANMYFSAGRAPQGRAEIERCVLEYPTDPEPHLILGDLATTERRWSDAELQYAAAERLLESFDGPDTREQSLRVQHLSGTALVAEGRAQWDIAQQQLQKLIELRPAQPGAQQRLASARFQVGDADAAFAGLQDAAKTDKKLPPAELVMAQVAQRAGKPDDAKAWLERAAQARPDDARPHIALADLHFGQSEFQEADQHAQAAEKIDSKSTEARFWRGTILRYLGKLDEAQNYLEQVVQEAPDHLQATTQLSMLLASREGAPERQRALKLAQLGAKAAPRSPEVAATLGWASLRLGDLDEAERLFKLAASSGSVSRDAAYYMAVLAQKRSRNSEARQLVSQALDSPGPFAHESDAKRLQTSLEKTK